MDQSSDKWHQWRGGGIGSSDAPTIMGISPYMTPYQLWLEKLGLLKRDDAGFAAALGHHFEPQARARFNLAHDMDVQPECAEHKELPYLRASLDGADLNKRVLIEIKYMGRANFDKCKSEKSLIGHHIPQVQHQFMVTGFSGGFYVPYTLTEDKKQIADIAYIPITRDVEYIQKVLFPAEREFWNCVQNQTPPPFVPKDRKLCKEKYYVDLAERYIATNETVNDLIRQMEDMTTKLASVSKHPVININNRLEVIRTVEKGNPPTLVTKVRKQ